MKKASLSITLVSILILLAATSISSASILFYDHFDDGVYLDKWEVWFQTSSSTITESGTDLRLYTKLVEETQGVALKAKTFFSSQDPKVEARIKPLGVGGMWLILFKDNDNYVRFGFSTVDTPYIETDGLYNGEWFQKSTCCSEGLLDGNYHTFMIHKSGNQYQTFIDGTKYHEITHDSIGDSNLRAALWSETFAWKYGDANNYIDYVKVEGEPQCPQWAMPGPNSGCPTCSCAAVALGEMGTFNQDYTAWTWNETYLNQMDNWGTWNAHDQPEWWKPRRAVNWMPVQGGGPPQLHVRYMNSGVTTRAYFQLPQNVIEYPEVYRWTHPTEGNKGFVAAWSDQPPTHPAFNKKIPLETVPGDNGIIPFSRITSVKWNETGIELTPLSEFYGVQNESILSIPYDFNPNLQTSTRFSPERGKYSFWPDVPSCSPEPCNWTTYNLPMVYAYFGKGIVPESMSTNTITVTLDNNGYGAGPYEFSFINGDTNSTPLVQTYTTKQVGPAKNPQTVTQQHVWAYENNGNLVIKWDEPADLIAPYWQIRVFIGDKYSNDTPSPVTQFLSYAFLEVPPPSGTAVLPAATWTKLKGELRSKNENTVYISVYYRRIYQNTTSGKNEMMQVRSQSDALAYTFTFP